MHKIIKRLAVAGLAAATVGLGAATVHAEPTTWTPTTATYTPSALPDGLRDYVTPDQAYAAYIAAYGEGNGCRADFDQAYQGTLRLTELPEALSADLEDQRTWLDGDGPAMADYEDGSVIQLIDRPWLVIVIDQYKGACE